MSEIKVSRRMYWIALAGLFLLSVAIRVPAVFQDLPPYTFCDEDIFFGDAYRMFVEGSWRSTEFRSGNFNVYPVLVIARFLELFVPIDGHFFLIIGRLFYSVLLSSLTVVVVGAATRTLLGRRDVALLAAVGYVLSPTVLAVSRYWYPDHYLMFFTAAILFWIARIFTARRSVIEYALFGATWGLALSAKYTFVLLALPIALALLFSWRKFAGASPWRELVRTILLGLLLLATTAIVFLLVNVSGVVNPEKFQQDFEFNFSNYGREGTSLGGVVFYSFLLFILTLGILGVTAWVVGALALARSSWMTLVMLLALPVVLVVYLGLQGLVINRNVMIAFPLMLPVFGLGVAAIIGFAREAKTRRVRVVVLVGLLAAAGLQVVQIASSIAHDLQPDSRIEAADWIHTNVPAGSTVGMNEFCSGQSPAAQKGNEVVFDPNLQLGLDYYVIDSYWDSIFNGAYRGQSAVDEALDQRYIHFYFFNDRGLPLYFLRYFTPDVEAEDLVPSGYELVKKFSSNGPDILVIERQG